MRSCKIDRFYLRMCREIRLVDALQTRTQLFEVQPVRWWYCQSKTFLENSPNVGEDTHTHTPVWNMPGPQKNVFCKLMRIICIFKNPAAMLWLFRKSVCDELVAECVGVGRVKYDFSNFMVISDFMSSKIIERRVGLLVQIQFYCAWNTVCDIFVF